MVNPYKLLKASKYLKEPITYTNLSIKSDTYINTLGYKRELLDSSLKQRKDTDSLNNKGELSRNLLKRIKRSNKLVLITEQDQYIYNLRVEQGLI